MRLTKFDHSCFALEKSGHTIIFDPVEYGFSLPDFPILDAIIITHSHPDHCQTQVIQKLSSRHPQTPIFTTQDNSILSLLSTATASTVPLYQASQVPAKI